MEFEFFYDVVCPYAYMASRHVEAMARRTGARILWRPILLGGVFKTIGRAQGATAGQSPARVRMGALDLARQAQRRGVTLSFPPDHPRRTVDAMRLILTAPEDLRPAVSHDLFHAYWALGRDVSQPAVLAEIAYKHGLDPEQGKTPAIKDALFEATRDAVDKGVFGVPGFALGERLYWGADRMHLVEKALGGDPAWPDGAGWGDARGATVTFYHDFSSPFSYLASTQLERIAHKHGAAVVWKPMLLGALFRGIGGAMVPLLTFTPPKQRYYRQDLEDWADWWGVPLRFPSTFPLRTVQALRVALADPETTPHIYEAAWVRDVDIGNPELLTRILDDAGFDAAALMEATQESRLKTRLRTHTEEAQALGACGAPTFVIESPGDLEPMVIWGQDCMDLVEAALTGWRPRQG